MVFMSLSYSLSAFMTTKASGETLCSFLDLYMEPEMPRPAPPLHTANCSISNTSQSWYHLLWLNQVPALDSTALGSCI